MHTVFFTAKDAPAHKMNLDFIRVKQGEKIIQWSSAFRQHV